MKTVKRFTGVLVILVMSITMFACSGTAGDKGADGKSAYEIAVENGYTGSQSEWLDLLTGAKGDTGLSAYEIAVANGYTGTQTQWLAILIGAKGDSGLSAYDIALANGFAGTEAEWLLSLIGPRGPKGDKGDTGLSAYEIYLKNYPGYEGGEIQWLDEFVIGHDYDEGVITPAGVFAGHTDFTCKRCGHAYQTKISPVFKPQVSAGHGHETGHSVALDVQGNLWTWGYNAFGQLGNGTSGMEAKRTLPGKIGTDIKFITVSAGQYHSLAIDEYGAIWAWGYNWYGQLGDGTAISRSSPVQIKNDVRYTAISAAHTHSLAIDENGNLWAWGANSFTTWIGDRTADIRSPIKILADTKFTSISAGYDNNLAIDEDGNLWSWGMENINTIVYGNGPAVPDPSPEQIMVGTKFISAARGNGHCLAVDVDGNLWAWGSNSFGQLGIGESKMITSGQVKPGTKFISASVGHSFSLATDEHGNLWAWGNNNTGSLGDGNTEPRGDGIYINRYFPVQIKDGTKFISISAGSNFSLFLDGNGNVWTCGENTDGQLGNGTTTSFWTPNPEPFLVVNLF